MGSRGWLWTGLFCVLIVYQPVCVADIMLDMLDNFVPISTIAKINDFQGDDLMRKVNLLGTLPDGDFTEVYERKQYNYDDNFETEAASGGHFRQQVKTRGSDVPRYEPVKSWKHEPLAGEPQGCGNPVCVVIDRKPRRFQSLCQFRKFLKDNSRSEQINFVQKGDCYDIIDNEKEGGALNKPWSSNAQDCKKCKEDPYCADPVTLIVDIQSFIYGESSAPGGPHFKASNNKGSKMSAFPFEFNNTCEAMQFAERQENLNIKTQVIGYFVGSVNTYFSTSGGESCIYTEWFDHDTPCNSEREVEKHCDHFQYLQPSYTGAYRICSSGDIIETQHEGGSEITQISAEDAQQGRAVGRDNTPFKQNINFGKQSLSCMNKEQEPGMKLPPPFVYSDDLNTTCLDYKTRYCCKTKAMFRPISKSEFDARMIPSLPMGLTFVNVKYDTNGNIVTALFGIGSAKDKDIDAITIKFNNNGEATVSILENGKSMTARGNYTIRKMDDNSMIVRVSIYHLYMNKKTELGYVEFRTHPSREVPVAVAAIVKDTNIVVTSITQIDLKGGSEVIFEEVRQDLTIIVTDDAQLYLQNVLKYSTKVIKGKETITIIGELRGTTLKIESREGFVSPIVDKSKHIWQIVHETLVTLRISMLVDSPPMATLFHECEWRDWVNIDYPDKRGSLKGEYELRHLTYNMTDRVKHVCGKIPENAHYIDAATVEDQIPWHELKMVDKVYEVFKLTPFFGYACKDTNGNKEYCKDMKVRYCCAKEQGATWGEWQPWSDCTLTCGGGIKKRQRYCEVNENKKGSLGYKEVCPGSELWNSAETRNRAAFGTVSCNVERCPEDSHMSVWSAWGRCSITCGQGFKKRTRYCMPAISGGRECPDRIHKKEEYEQSQQCTMKDCEVFVAGLWSMWSSCSNTCGDGVMERTRGCRSDQTGEKVDEKYCANDPDFFTQTQNCNLGHCPIDGGWSIWTLWSACSQNCVDHPDSNSKVRTKAYIKRVRYCANPMTSYNGKPCEKNPKHIFNSNTDSEEERADCITSMDQGGNIDKNVDITPWCPVHCIYSLWSEWSACSETCIKLPYVMVGYNEKKLDNVQYGINVVKNMPLRSRLKVLVREPRFGGECPEQESNYDTPGSNNGTVIEQKEECKLCPKHCSNDKNPTYPDKINVKYFTNLPYPGDDPACIGYCAVNCSLKEPKLVQDALVEMKKYIQAKGKLLNDREEEQKENDILLGRTAKGTETASCFLPETMLAAADAKRMDIVENIKKIWEKFLAKPAASLKEKDIDELDDELLKYARNMKKENDGDEEIYALYKVLRNVIYKDTDWMRLLRFSIKKQYVNDNGPADGLVDGINCINPITKKIITSRDWLYKADNKQYTRTPFVEYYEGANILLCEVMGPEILPAQIHKCEIISWAEWGDWGACNIKCGDQGRRTRRRDCINTCTKEKKEDELCPPYVDSVSGKQWSNEYTAVCTPCPPEVIGSWSEWSSWSFASQPSCTNENEPKMMKRTRKRKCIAGPEVKECQATQGGLTSGVDEETIEFQMPICGY